MSTNSVLIIFALFMVFLATVGVLLLLFSGDDLDDEIEDHNLRMYEKKGKAPEDEL